MQASETVRQLVKGFDYPIAKADILYGVTMEERGISKLVGMRLTEAQPEGATLPAREESPPRRETVSRSDRRLRGRDVRLRLDHRRRPARTRDAVQADRVTAGRLLGPAARSAVTAPTPVRLPFATRRNL